MSEMMFVLLAAGAVTWAWDRSGRTRHASVIDIVVTGPIWAIATLSFVAVYTVIAILVSPVLVPYAVVRSARGPRAAAYFAWLVIGALITIVGAYQVYLWSQNPASFFLLRST